MTNHRRSTLIFPSLALFVLLGGVAAAAWWNPFKKDKYPDPPHPDATSLAISETRTIELDPKQPQPQPCGVYLNKGEMIRIKPLEGVARQEWDVVLAMLPSKSGLALKEEHVFRVSESGELRFVCIPTRVKDELGPLRVEVSREDPSALKTAADAARLGQTAAQSRDGKVQYQGEWMTTEERDRRIEVEQKARGNIYYRGQWITPDEKKAAEEIQSTLDDIRHAAHVPFPTPGKAPGAAGARPRLVVLNDTSGYLDLYMSGPVARKFVLAPKDKRDIEVPAGEYELGVRPEDRAIVPFHGFLGVDEGTNYSWRLFLVQSPAQP